MSRVRVCFLGTPEFAVTCLRRLLEDEHYEVVGVVTQPDRPSGRKLLPKPSPVKSLAIAKGLRVISPDNLKSALIQEEIANWGAEIAIVVAFGQILTSQFMGLFRFGAVNVHGSILPRWRGAAPIQRAIEHGDQETGVSLQKMVKELDAGDVIGARRIAISDEMNAQELYDELAKLGADLLHIELMDFIRGNLAPTPQNPDQVTYAKKIDKAEAELNFNLPARSLHNRIRAFVMGPGTWTLCQGKKLKVHRSRFKEQAEAKPGVVHSIDTEAIWLGTSAGLLGLVEVQAESRNRMTIGDFVKGYQIKVGEQFG